ncbi:MAG: lysophospholipid acyltransferase family protein [Desulfatiglans sp.]|jgi:1-acyl-sn-glycerol-3-phosphate acyltransferase|nr:lysophospholipid acyltransferase family protein [Desulfatiglans sp.]
MVRFISLNSFIAIYSIIMCLWVILLSFFDRSGRKIHFFGAVPWAKIILWVCGIKVRAVGEANIDPLLPRIYMCNHQSYFDILALLAYLPVDFKFIMKQELMKIPLLGFCMKRAGYISISREDPRKAIKGMKEAAEKAREGISILIFPEGTRSVDGRLQDFKKGGFNLALKSGCDIVPVTIKNSYRIVPKGSLRINRGSFEIHFARPIPLGSYSKRNIVELMERVKGVMSGRINGEGIG